MPVSDRPLLDALRRQHIMPSPPIALLMIAFAVSIGRSYGADSSSSSSSGSSAGKWSVVNNATRETCITLQAALSFKLTYTINGEMELSEPVTINVPSNAAVDYNVTVGNGEASTCNATFSEDSTIAVQILRLKFWDTWWTEFHFTRDKNKLGAPSQQQFFNLFQVIVFADYANANHTLFPGHYNTSKWYYQRVHANGDGALTQVMFAAPQHTFVCPSKQEYLVVENPDGAAYLIVSNLKVQAFATGSAWMESEICPEDQQPDDILPVIVGGILALLVVVTLIGYLIYRCRLPPETLHMTNPNSHFEDIAFENKIDVLEDEFSSDAESHPRVSHHSNGKH